MVMQRQKAISTFYLLETHKEQGDSQEAHSVDDEVEVEGIWYLPETHKEQRGGQQAHTVDGEIEIEGHVPPLHPITDEEADPQPRVESLNSQRGYSHRQCSRPTAQWECSELNSTYFNVPGHMYSIFREEGLLWLDSLSDMMGLRLMPRQPARHPNPILQESLGCCFPYKVNRITRCCRI